MVLLVRQGVVSPPVSPVATPAERLQSEFRLYLQQERALASTTQNCYLTFVSDFLTERFGTGRVDLSGLCAADVTGFVRRRAVTIRSKRVQLMTTALRSFLRFARYRGDIDKDLAAVAISNGRLLSLEEGRVRFRWRDSQDNNQIKEMSLDAVEFIRRFLLHVLPGGFVKIRHFGFLSNRNRQAMVQRCRELLPASPPLSLLIKPGTSLPGLRDRTPPCDRTAIHGTGIPKRSTAPTTSFGLFIKPMILAILILRPRRSPIRDHKRRVQPKVVGRPEKPIATPHLAEFDHAAHLTATQLSVRHVLPAGKSSCTPETN